MVTLDFSSPKAIFYVVMVIMVLIGLIILAVILYKYRDEIKGLIYEDFSGQKVYTYEYY